MDKFKSGQYIHQGHYKSFEPTTINKTWSIIDMNVLNLLSKADRALGRLDMFSEYVNIELFIQMHITKEATKSSKIEGTQTNMEEVFMKRDEIGKEKIDDWLEVNNYIRAMNEAVQQLHTLPFSSRLIKLTHKILLQGARGELKMPGEFRRSQNWIGGATINDATFIPPVHTSIDELMSDLEKFANDEQNPLPELIKVAMVHYQFETIHPFLDGNGRVGRLLITLFLVNKGILKKPILYLSDFFEKNRSLYYDNLTRVRSHHDLNQWLKFFLTGVIETASGGIETLNGILQLEKTLNEKIKELGLRTSDADKVIKHLYVIPIISTTDVAEIIEKSPKTAYKLVADLEKLGILREMTGTLRGKIYIFHDYMNLFNS
jgi:Fic family protein